ncbi:putative glycoprotein hormone G-protein coupled receptor [Convolutriloba macropyga]|uniref:putative glycoprotein hormone G-protein coupled receptor n=1 Tax=Convolutriloba macropyga TaxID=536237 RepID=UPI003F51EE98
MNLEDIYDGFEETNFTTAFTTKPPKHTTPSAGWSVFADINDTLREVNFIVSLVLGFCGLVLNTVTLIVLLDEQLRGKNKYKLIISLSFVDFFSCVTAVLYAHCDPQWLLPEGALGEFLCKVVFSRFLYYLLSATSAWHLVMICVERFIFIIYNDWYEANFGTKANLFLILCSWVIGLGAMGYNFTAYKTYNRKCALEWATKLDKTVATVEELVLMVLVPISVMGVLYYLVYRREKEFNEIFGPHAPCVPSVQHRMAAGGGGRGAGKRSPSIHVDHNQTRFSNLLLILAYLICWAPNEFLFAGYGLELIGNKEDIFTTVPFYVTQILINLSSVFNPFLYACFFQEFRTLLKRKLANCCSAITACLCCRPFPRGPSLDPIVVASYDSRYRVTSVNSSHPTVREVSPNDFGMSVHENYNSSSGASSSYRNDGTLM